MTKTTETMHATPTADLTWADPGKVAEVLAGVRTEADAAWWGFDPEDATRYLQAALDSGANRVVVPALDKPWVVEPLAINRDDLEVVFAQGAVVEARKGSFHGPNDVLLKIWNRRNIVLSGYGATLRMHKTDYWHPPYQRSEWRHALDMRGCTGVQVEGLTFRDSGGDGIYLSGTDRQPHVSGVTIRDVVCDGNHRQGMSVISAEDLLVERCDFSNTLGTAPMAGIDLEPNQPWQCLVNITIRNNLVLCNSQLGLHVWLSHLTRESRPVSILWESNVVRGGEIGIHVATLFDNGPGGQIRFQNNIVEDTQHAGILVRQVSASSGMRVEFAGNILRDTARRGPYDTASVEFYRWQSGLQDPSFWWRPMSPSAPIVLAAQRNQPARQGNVHFDNDLVFHASDDPVLIVGGLWGKHKELFGQEGADGADVFQGWTNVSGTLRVVNPCGTGIDIQTPVENFTVTINRKEDK